MTRRTKAPALTESEWQSVFKARCNSKRGFPNTEAERELIERAFKENRKRYGEMDAAVFNATVPFGSTVRMEERKAKIDGNARR